jgi:lipopolysaccharide export system permease protein
MRVLDRYIIGTIFSAVALVIGVLVTLTGLFSFIADQGDLGVGNYGALQLARFVLLNLPGQMLGFVPVAALIGTLLGMGLLARDSELTVMRAAGMSVLRIGASMSIAGVLLMVLSLLIAEFIAPAATEWARTQRTIDRFQSISYVGRGGIWVRDGNLILKAEQRTSQSQLRGITVFEMSADDRLISVGHADSAAEREQGGWDLRNYAASSFGADDVVTRIEQSMPLQTVVSSAFLAATTADPMDLSMRELRRGIGYLAANGSPTHVWQFAFWSILARAVAIPFAVLLALPFLFGSLRSSSNGARAVLGLVLGLAYYIVQRMVQNGTAAFDLNPLLLAWLPTVILAVTVGVLLWRVRT